MDNPCLDSEKKLTPVYIGDDQNDEEHFWPKNRGITILYREGEKILCKVLLRNVKR